MGDVEITTILIYVVITITVILAALVVITVLYPSFFAPKKETAVSDTETKSEDDEEGVAPAVETVKEAEESNKQLKVSGVDALEHEINEYDLASGPNSTMLSANEIYLLDKAGYCFIQVVMGNVVYSMGLRGLFRTVNRAFRRGEMVDFTRLINDARVVAHRRMLKQAMAVNATDVVAVEFQTHEYADFLEVTVLGAAVRKVKDAEDIPVATSAS